jgi:ABC-type transporter Mla MlaB component
MDIYQHDSAAMFQFVLRGELIGDRVRELEHAWNTAKSILKGKELVIDISGITNADPSGIDLLSRMRESGARLTPALPSEPGDVLHSWGVPVPASGQHDGTPFSKALALYRTLERMILNRGESLSRCDTLRAQQGVVRCSSRIGNR